MEQNRNTNVEGGMMRTNKFPADCTVCGSRVPANGGELKRSGRRWVVRHLACTDRPSVMTVGIGDKTFTRNVRGRCEDAPCCGCCTI